MIQEEFGNKKSVMNLDVLGFTRFTIIFMKSERYILFLFCFLSFFARRGGGDGKKV